MMMIDKNCVSIDKGESIMGWFIIVIIAYLPIIYKIHRRLDHLEKEVNMLKGEKEQHWKTD